MSKMTMDQAIAALEEVVAEFGEDYTYEYPEGALDTCYYSDEAGNPGCIVGQVLAKHFPEIFEAVHKSEWEDAEVVTSEDGGYSYVVPSGNGEALGGTWWSGKVFTEGAIYVLFGAQQVQDEEASWGVALDVAKERAIEFKLLTTGSTE